MGSTLGNPDSNSHSYLYIHVYDYVSTQSKLSFLDLLYDGMSHSVFLIGKSRDFGNLEISKNLCCIPKRFDGSVTKCTTDLKTWDKNRELTSSGIV